MALSAQTLKIAQPLMAQAGISDVVSMEAVKRTRLSTPFTAHPGLHFTAPSNVFPGGRVDVGIIVDGAV